MQTLGAKGPVTKFIVKAIKEEKSRWKRTNDTVDVNGTLTVVPGKLVREESRGESNPFSDAQIFLGGLFLMGFLVLKFDKFIKKIDEFLIKHKL